MGIFSWFGKDKGPDAAPQQSGGCPVMHAPKPAAGAEGASSCPVPHDQRNGHHPMILLDPRNNMQAGGESQFAGVGQNQALEKNRVTSTIPRGDFKPGHQEQVDSTTWVYPSEQMFFNAMKRKGWEPKEQDMRAVVGIHNAVNERSWAEVMKWEKLHASTCGKPRLVKFQGRPTDFSPRARFNSLMGYTLPFDRHDWVVDRCGTEVRYVIDFYTGKTDPTGERPVSYYLDVRPALDSWQSVVDRANVGMQGYMPSSPAAVAGAGGKE